MPDTTSADVFSGRVLEWHSEEGWGVLASDALPDRVWYRPVSATDGPIRIVGLG